LATDELIEVLGEQAPGLAEVDAIIMAARAHWFDDEPEPKPAEDEIGTAPAEAGDVAQSGETTEV
jgi:N utilization substance protein A